MEISLEQFRANFRGHPIPKILEELFLFETFSQEYYGGRFELSVLTQESLSRHLQEEALSEFFGIGRDAKNSHYALWRYKEINLDDAPVVYLDSEGEGSTVLAHNLKEFLTLLAYDESDLSYGVFSKHDEYFEHTPRNKEFRKWIAQHYQLKAARSPNAIVDRASQHFPPLPLREY